MYASRFFDVGVDISAVILQKDSKESNHRYAVKPHLEKVANAMIGPLQQRFINADSTAWGRSATVKVSTPTHSVPIMTKKGVVFSDIDDVIRHRHKIIIPRDLGYYPKLDADGEYGFIWQSRAMIVDTTAEAESAYSVFSSILFRWVMKKISWVPQTDFTLLSMIKLPPLDRKWENDDLLAFYGLVSEDLI